MTATHNAGPVGTFGWVPNTSGLTSASGLNTATGGSNPDAGPNFDYQGSSVVDVRYPYMPGRTGLGQVTAALNYAYACMADCVPSIKNTAIVAAAQTPVVPVGGSVAMTLASTNQISPATNGNRAVNVPLVPFGSALRPANAVSCLCLDPGHTVGTTTSGSATVASVGDIRLITPGQYVGLPGAGGTGVTLIARVLSKTYSTSSSSGAGSILLDTAASASVSAGPIMLMEWRSPNDTTGGSSVVPWYYAGSTALMDPHYVPGRCLTVTNNNAGDTGYSISVTGYDIFGVAMTESINVSANATATGAKAWKYITGVSLVKSGGGTPTGTISVGTSDTFGFAMKSEKWEYMNIYFAGAFISTSTGWTTAVNTKPATSSTGDVRGTYALQSASTGSASTGTMAFFMSLPARQLIASSYNDATPLFGVAQA